MGWFSDTFGGSANTGDEGNEGNEGNEHNEANEGNEGDEGNEGNPIRDFGSALLNIGGNVLGAIDRAAGFIGDHNGNEDNEGNEGDEGNPNISPSGEPQLANEKGIVPGQASIVASEFALLGAFAHITLTLYNSQGQRVEEINGLATDADGTVKAIGLPLNFTDKIKIYSMTQDGIILDAAIDEEGRFASHHNIWTGTDAELQALHAEMLVAGDQINDLDLGYRATSQNSNSGANSVTKAVDLELPAFNRFAPGAGNDLLDQGGSQPNGGEDGIDGQQGWNGHTNIEGSAGADILSGGESSDVVFGGAGDDQIDGGYGSDMLVGGDGNDVITGGQLNSSDQIQFNILIDSPNQFASNQGWGNEAWEREVGDVNGDGHIDIVGFGGTGVTNGLTSSQGQISEIVVASSVFGADTNWGLEHYERRVADVDGDGRADLVAFGSTRVYFAPGQTDGTFGGYHVATYDYGAADTWGQEEYERRLADVNGDGRADVVAFGNTGVYTSFGTADGQFLSPLLGTDQLGTQDYRGVDSVPYLWGNEQYEREVGDVNGDGYADLIGFGADGTYVSLSYGTGYFGLKYLATSEFGSNTGWGNEAYERRVEDVNGDGYADIIGFGQSSTVVAYGKSDGTFGPSFVASTGMDADAGWGNEQYERRVGDVNGDGVADVVLFGPSGTSVVLGDLPDFGSDQIFGGDGDDLLRGEQGDDMLCGQDGNDTLEGGSGRDILEGGLGADVLTGGAQADVFVFDLVNGGGDQVTDFQVGIDAINLVCPYGEMADGITLADAVTITNDGGDAIITFDADGAGSGGGVQVARLNGIDAANLELERDIWVVEREAPPPDPDPNPDPDPPVGSWNIITSQSTQEETLSGTADADKFVVPDIAHSTRVATDEIVGFSADDVLDLSALGFTSIGHDGQPGNGHLLVVEHGVGQSWEFTRVLSGWGDDDLQIDLDGVVGVSLDQILLTSDNPPDPDPDPDPDPTKTNTPRTLPDEVAINWGNRIDGTGSADDLTGTANDDYINGKGGDDTMTGGQGDDVYNVYQDGDLTVEQAGQGIDRVLAGIDLTLQANIEQGTVNTSSGRQLTGNALDNRLEGNSGDDELIGGAGSDWLIGDQGADTLTGGADADVFVYTGSGQGADTITDFQVGIDSIDLRQLSITASDVSLSAVDTSGNGSNDAIEIAVSINGGSETLAVIEGVTDTNELDIGYDIWVA